MEKLSNNKIECDQCDGCGWHEGGPTLKTKCKTCKGRGWVRPNKTTNDRRPLTDDERERLVAMASACNTILASIDVMWANAKAIDYTAFKSVLVRPHDRRAFKEAAMEINSILKKGFVK